MMIDSVETRQGTRREVGLCRDCLYWSKLKSTDFKGECRPRRPTALFEEQIEKDVYSDNSEKAVVRRVVVAEALWPITDHNDFCGEWEAWLNKEGEGHV